MVIKLDLMIRSGKGCLVEAFCILNIQMQNYGQNFEFPQSIYKTAHIFIFVQNFEF